MSVEALDAGRVLIPTRDLTTAGILMTAGQGSVNADSANQHYIEDSGDDIILVCLVGGGATGVVTVKFSPHPLPPGDTINRTFTPAQNMYTICGPFPSGFYEQSQTGTVGGVHVNVAAGTTIVFFAVRVPRRPGY